MSGRRSRVGSLFFFFNDTATTEIYTLSLHDALPIYRPRRSRRSLAGTAVEDDADPDAVHWRSEEHTSELQSRLHLVCRLLLEKKKKKSNLIPPTSTTHVTNNHLSSSATLPKPPLSSA